MFKITIQPESDLARELESYSLPRQRNSRLIELATIGLAFCKSSGAHFVPAQKFAPNNTKIIVDDSVTCEKMTSGNSSATLVTEKQNPVASEADVKVGNTDFGNDLLSL